jgi:hypothetical protein
MRDEMGILIRLTDLVSVWYPNFPLKRMDNVSDWRPAPFSYPPNSVSSQQTSIGPTGSIASGTFLVENKQFGSMEAERQS